jgi:diguanylate cyclase (GGDEF)-like protein
MEKPFRDLEFSEKKEYVQKKIRGNLDWISTLSKKVEEGIISKEQGDMMIARAMAVKDVRKERAEDEAKRDALTGLYNKGTFNKEYEKLVEEKSLFALLILDIDNFKNINDSYGYLAGDDVLSQTALNLTTNLRQLRGDDNENDFIARWGGDEFAILLKDIHEDSELEIVANKLVKIMSERAFLIKITGEAQDVPVGISIGAGVYKGGDKNIFFELVDKQAIKQAKQTGKNKAVIINQLI